MYSCSYFNIISAFILFDRATLYLYCTCDVCFLEYYYPRYVLKHYIAKFKVNILALLSRIPNPWAALFFVYRFFEMRISLEPDGFFGWDVHLFP